MRLPKFRFDFSLPTVRWLEYQSLTHRYMLFLTAVMIVLLAGSLIITATVVRSAMIDLYRRQLSRTQNVLKQYAGNRHFVKRSEFNRVTTSPQFIETMEDGNGHLLRSRIHLWRDVLDAEMLLITDKEYETLATAGNIPRELIDSLVLHLPGTYVANLKTRFLLVDGNSYEFTINALVDYQNRPIGYLAAGGLYNGEFARDLSRLTGFNVMLIKDGRIFGHAGDSLATILASVDNHGLVTDAPLGAIYQTEIDGEHIIEFATTSEYINGVVVFAGSIDTNVLPIVSRASTFLLLLVGFSGIIALIVMYLFTNRRIGRQVDLLVDAANRVATNDFDFTIEPQSNDELGYLAVQFELMRSRILENRQALQNAQEKRVQAERLATVGKLAAGIVHDFKNPMSIVRGTAEMVALQNRRNHKITLQCETITSQIDRMAALTRDILEYSRGSSHLDREEVPLDEYFKEIELFHLPAFNHKNLNLIIHGEEDLRVNIDPHRFRRVIDNLLNNAREALTAEGRVVIRWFTHHDAVLIEVADDGPGIPADIGDSLFDPFVTRNKEDGTGLGLAIARKIVEDHGGMMGVESRAGEGSTFRISLPKAAVTRTETEVSRVTP